MPQLLYLGSYINNDSLALLSISIIVYSWIIGFESNWSWKSCILLGIGIGICSLSYYNAYGYILCSIIIYIASCFIKKIKFKEFLKKGLLIALIAFLIGGWWFIRSFIIYDGDFLGLNSSRECGEKYALDFLKPSKRETPSKRQMGWRLMVFKSGWTRTSVLSFIGVFGGMTEKMSLPVYLFYFISLLLGMICFVLNLIIELFDIIDKKQKNEKKEKSKLFEKILFYIIMIASIIIPTFLSVYYSYYMDYQPQGRYLMPAMIPLMFFVVKGLEKIFDNEKLKKFNKFFFGLIILLWVVMPIYVYFQYIRVL